ncbi:hypothetical protein ACFL2Q_06530 [Thermodesulfobacteriota bacterium]
MGPVLAFVRFAGAAFITSAALALAAKKLMPKPSDVVAGAVHFKKGMEEFQRGIELTFFGASEPSQEEIKKKKESSRVLID